MKQTEGDGSAPDPRGRNRIDLGVSGSHSLNLKRVEDIGPRPNSAGHRKAAKWATESF